jgi:hypothetical protein
VKKYTHLCFLNSGTGAGDVVAVPGRRDGATEVEDKDSSSSFNLNSVHTIAV